MNRDRRREAVAGHRLGGSRFEDGRRRRVRRRRNRLRGFGGVELGGIALGFAGRPVGGRVGRGSGAAEGQRIRGQRASRGSGRRRWLLLRVRLHRGRRDGNPGQATGRGRRGWRRFGRTRRRARFLGLRTGISRPEHPASFGELVLGLLGPKRLLHGAEQSAVLRRGEKGLRSRLRRVFIGTKRFRAFLLESR